MRLFCTDIGNICLSSRAYYGLNLHDAQKGRLDLGNGFAIEYVVISL